jgi:hypothetical protein
MDADSPARRRVLAVLAAVGVLALALVGGMALLRDDGGNDRSATTTSVPRAGTGSSATSPPTSADSPGGAVSPGVTSAGEGTDAGAGTGPTPAPGGARAGGGGAGPAGTDPPATTSPADPEGCDLLRELLGLIDDAELREAAESVGCI